MMSDREPVKIIPPTPEDVYARGYAAGVRDGAERADQWASNRLGMGEGDLAADWVRALLPASMDVLKKRNSSL